MAYCQMYSIHFLHHERVKFVICLVIFNYLLIFCSNLVNIYVRQNYKGCAFPLEPGVCDDPYFLWEFIPLSYTGHLEIASIIRS